jgi:hypothetical protein
MVQQVSDRFQEAFGTFHAPDALPQSSQFGRRFQAIHQHPDWKEEDMKRTSLIIALALLSAAPSAARADPRIAKLCGPDHVNEAVSADDVRANPAGFYVSSLREQVSLGDPRIVLTTDDDFYLCTRTAATPGMDATKATLLIKERAVQYLFVPVIRRGTGSSS